MRETCLSLGLSRYSLMIRSLGVMEAFRVEAIDTLLATFVDDSERLPCEDALVGDAVAPTHTAIALIGKGLVELLVGDLGPFVKVVSYVHVRAPTEYAK